LSTRITLWLSPVISDPRHPNRVAPPATQGKSVGSQRSGVKTLGASRLSVTPRLYYPSTSSWTATIGVSYPHELHPASRKKEVVERITRLLVHAHSDTKIARYWTLALTGADTPTVGGNYADGKLAARDVSGSFAAAVTVSRRAITRRPWRSPSTQTSAVLSPLPAWSLWRRTAIRIPCWNPTLIFRELRQYYFFADLL